jgi:hypothetical protein
MTMKTKNATKVSGIRVTSSIKAGGLRNRNHNAVLVLAGLKVKSAVKAGGLRNRNHNAAPVRAH